MQSEHYSVTNNPTNNEIAWSSPDEGDLKNLLQLAAMYSSPSFFQLQDAP